MLSLNWTKPCIVKPLTSLVVLENGVPPSPRNPCPRASRARCAWPLSGGKDWWVLMGKKHWFELLDRVKVTKFFVKLSRSHRGWRESQRWGRQQRLRRRWAQSEPGAQSTTQPLNRWRQPAGKHCAQTQRYLIHSSAYIYSLVLYCSAILAALVETNASADSSTVSLLQPGKEVKLSFKKKT